MTSTEYSDDQFPPGNISITYMRRFSVEAQYEMQMYNNILLIKIQEV